MAIIRLTEDSELRDGTLGADTFDGFEGDDGFGATGGADTLRGLAGDDVFLLDSSSSDVSGLIDGGADIDTVRSYGGDLGDVTFENVEVLWLAGNVTATIAQLNAFATIVDGEGDGRLGIDLSEGGTIDFSDKFGFAAEFISIGALNATSAVDVTATAGVDRLEGSRFDDRLFGGAGDDTLYGWLLENNSRMGHDTLIGGRGNDSYHADKSDTLIERAGPGGGVDWIFVTGSFDLASDKLQGDFENLHIYNSTGAARGFGNELDNEIRGSFDDNYLDGREGADTLAGGGGADIYIVDDLGDVVIESPLNYDDDLVRSSVNFDLGRVNTRDAVENLKLTGAASIDGFGNKLSNNLAGNSGDNAIAGRGGDDTLTGGGGADTLTGGGGQDDFLFGSTPKAKNADVVTDFQTGKDEIRLDDAAFAALDNGRLDKEAFVYASSKGVATEADDRIIYNASTGRLFYDADGSGDGARKLIAILDPDLDLSRSDIFVY